jgi:diacylglycerol O-acyltransferase / trehalose O-mycolyltransferase
MCLLRRLGLALLAVALVALAQLGVGCGAATEPDRDRAGRGATVFREERVAPRIVDLNIRSPALGTTAMVRLLTPDGWATGRSSRRWPVLYLLHGCCDSYESWTRSTDIEKWPQLRNVLVVMPEGGAVGFYSNWHGSGRQPGPAWETFHLTEVRQLLERGYGAGRERAIAGLSMGGLGAMVYTARNPGLFRAAASFSGLLHPLQDTGLLLGLFSSFTPDPRAIWGDPARDRSIWARHDPTELADRLRGVPMFVSAGNGRPGPLEAAANRGDSIERTVFDESRAFVARLRRLDIPVRADFYGPGTHAWPYWEHELERALPTLLGALSA